MWERHNLCCECSMGFLCSPGTKWGTAPVCQAGKRKGELCLLQGFRMSKFSQEHHNCGFRIARLLLLIVNPNLSILTSLRLLPCDYFHKWQPLIQRLSGAVGQVSELILTLVPVLACAGVSSCITRRLAKCVRVVEGMAFPFALLVRENTDFCLCHQYPGKHGWQHYWALLQWGHVHPAHGEHAWRLQDHADWDLASGRALL